MRNPMIFLASFCGKRGVAANLALKGLGYQNSAKKFGSLGGPSLDPPLLNIQCQTKLPIILIERLKLPVYIIKVLILFMADLKT